MRVAEGLRHRGVEEVSVYHEGKTGVSDEAQLVHAGALEAVIFTHDSDLIEIAMERSDLNADPVLGGGFRFNKEVRRSFGF